DTLSVDDQIRFGHTFFSFVQKDSAVAPYALTLFRKIQASAPADWRAYWFLGAIEGLMHDDSSALMHFEKVKELAKWNPDGWVGVATVYYNRDRFDRAVDVLNDAKKIIPDDYQIHFLLGVSYQRSDRAVEAASSLERALQID